jgi:3-phenylpropionate/trans-cinnamate dioxygenase ferredoxin subunit
VIVGGVAANEPGCYQLDSARKLVKCGRHGFEYDLATGRSWYDPEHDRVRTYDVAVEPAELVAETFRVSVEDECVVVEV